VKRVDNEMMTRENLKRSQEIIDRAIADYQPYAIVIMFSGGHDSLAAYHVARALNVPVTHFMHGVTGTGIRQTTAYARRMGEQSGLTYLEANAGDAYEQYVLRKGFFGIGNLAHEYAYHILKHKHFRAMISQKIRHRKHGRNVLLINGARKQESPKRKQTIAVPIRAAGPNIWVNIINDWSAVERNDFLSEYERNPVCDILHRSGECLCGCTQWPYQETRREVSDWFPEWGRWLDDLEKRVRQCGFEWNWGEDIPQHLKDKKKLQKQVADGQLWLPMCQDCVAQSE